MLLPQMKTAFITRTKAEDKNDLDKQENLQNLIWRVRKSKAIYIIYIISKFKDENYKPSKKDIPIIVVKDNNPTGPISINTVLSKLSKIKDTEKIPWAFLVASKEVSLKKIDIENLITELKDNPNLLVAGYRFKIKDKRLNNELQGYYHNNNLIAYRVPWNTCAIWKYELFKKHVIKFDEITSRNPFNPVCVCIDSVYSQTEHKGMEDGLAIAQAVSKRNQNIQFKLLDKTLNWEVNGNNNKIKKHREKLARKNPVLQNFMAIRNYSVRDLENAEIK